LRCLAPWGLSLPRTPPPPQNVSIVRGFTSESEAESMLFARYSSHHARPHADHMQATAPHHERRLIVHSCTVQAQGISHAHGSETRIHHQHQTLSASIPIWAALSKIQNPIAGPQEGCNIAGETFQRPSPTDSNASNNTSEQAVNPLPRPSPPASAAAAALQKPPQGARATPAGRTPPLVAASKLGVKGGKVTKKQGPPPKGGVPAAAAKGKKPSMPIPTGPGRCIPPPPSPLHQRIP